MIHYSSFKQFALRTPLLPFSNLEYFVDAFSNPLNIELEELVEETILEAILIASPDLFDTLKKKRLLTELDENARMSLFKYLNRMSSRSTPFGLFSALSLGKITGETDIKLDNHKKFKKYARIDSAILIGVYNRLFFNKSFIKSQNFRLNETLYKIGNKYRLVTCYRSDFKYVHELTSIDNNKALKVVFRALNNNKSLQYHQIKDLLKPFGDDSVVEEFIMSLIISDVILLKDNISVTGSEILDQLSDIVGPDLESERAFIEQLQERKSRIDAAHPGDSIDEIVSIDRSIRSFFPDLQFKYPVQIDTLSTTKSAELNSDVAEEVFEAIRVLTALAPVIPMPGLADFKREFYKRYEEKEVPLSEALDVEIGIGFPTIEKFIDDNILIKNIDFNNVSPQNSFNLSQGDYYILSKYQEFLSQNLKEIALDVSLLENFKMPDRYSDTILAQVELLSKSRDAVNVLLINGGNSSAANFLTRFGYLDKSIMTLILEITKFEEENKKEQIIAEIVHLAQPRAANVLLRPTVRAYEIPYCSNTSVGKDKRIPLDDIMVSVKGGQHIVLRSKRLNKIINPKLTSAHNHLQDNLPIYQFLAALQYQYVNPSTIFNWPSVLQTKAYLPRVRFKNVVLSPATWNFNLGKDVNYNDFDYHKFKTVFIKYADNYEMPSIIFLIDKDNRLLIDRTSDFNLKILYKEVKKNNAVKLIEFLYDMSNMAVSDDEGNSHLNEVILFYKKDNGN